MTPAQRRELLEDSWKQGGLAMLGTFADLMTNAEANESVAEFVRGKIDEARSRGLSGSGARTSTEAWEPPSPSKWPET